MAAPSLRLGAIG